MKERSLKYGTEGLVLTMAEKKDFSMAKLALKTYNRKLKFCQLRRTANEPCIEYEKDLQFIDDCLSVLPERDAEVLKAFYILDLPRTDVMEIVNAEWSQMYRIKEKALEKFAELYETRERKGF